MNNLYLLQMLGFDFEKIARSDHFQTHFKDLGLLGAGGFAEVRKVESKSDGKIFAVKIITIKTSRNLEETQQHFYRVLSEAKVHAQLSHPHVLQYHGCWMELTPFSEQERSKIEQEEPNEAQFQMVVQDDSFGSDGFVFEQPSTEKVQPPRPDQSEKKSEQSRQTKDPKVLTFYKEIKLFMLTEPCQMNLQTFIYERSKRPERGEEDLHLQQNLEIALEMTKGLSYIHSKRIIHRDIKLHNFLLDEKLHCKLLDFGLARKVRFWKSSIEEKKRQSGLLLNDGDDEESEDFSKSVGTRLFSSPQQASSEKYDYRTDIFSLAMTIVLLFCSFATVHEQRTLIEVIRQRKLEGIQMPPRLKSLMFRCLGNESQRSSLGEIQSTLRELLKEKRMHRVQVPLGARAQNVLDSADQQILVNDSKYQ